MSFESRLLTETLPAAANLSSDQYCFAQIVNTSGAAQINLNTTAGGPCCGVLQDNQSIVGSAATYGYNGISKVYCGGTFTPGQAIMSDANGHAVVQTGSNTILGYAVESGASGQLAAIKINC